MSKISKLSELINSICWQTGEPPSDVCLYILCSDYSGEYISKATRKNYKTPKKGQSPKGFKNNGKGGWRWVNSDDQALSRKQKPEKWAYITKIKALNEGEA